MPGNKGTKYWGTGRSPGPAVEEAETGYQTMNYTARGDSRGRASARSTQTDPAGLSPTSTDSAGLANNESFVTEPPRPRQGLTGKISTLFRRESSRERSRERSTASAKSSRRKATTPVDRPAPQTTPVAVPPTQVLKHSASRGSRASRGDDVSVASTGSKRIFYSSQGDDDSDDSYASRVSRKSQSTQERNRRSVGSAGTEGSTTLNSGSMTTSDQTKMILRYRGFSTSIKHLFLDETVVCASMGCFGLILSNRTEYLLQLRNERRGALTPRTTRGAERKKGPSRIVAYGLVVTIILMFSTFVVWGFGTGNGLASAYYRGYYDADSAQDEMQQDLTDDYQQQQYGYDDALNENERYWKQNQNQADDGFEQQQQADDGYNYANQNYNDDGNNKYNANQQYNQNAYNAKQQYNQNAYNNNNGDDFYAYNDEGDNRRVKELGTSGDSKEPMSPFCHPLHGVFKLRDYQENLWNPVYEFLQDEWDRGRSDKETSDNRWLQRYYDQVDDVVADTKHNRDVASHVRMALLFGFLFFLGVLGRRRRMRTRFYLVRARAQEDNLYYASTAVGSSRRIAFEDAREDQYEGACSHTLCGCYPVDEGIVPSEEDNEVEVTDDGIFKRKRTAQHEDIVARGFSCLMGACCGLMCKCWFQCLSICALAQEAREIRLLVPPRYQRIDFITHQPFHEYQKDVNDLRRGWLGKTRKKAGFRPHFSALSRLSRYILITFTLCFTIIIATLVFNPRAAFSWQDAVVLVATFLQAFLVLFIIHWIFHKSDLSLDAVIKFFAAGFVIAVPSAFLAEGVLVNVVLFAAWTLFEIVSALFGSGFLTWVLEHWRALWIFGELINAYIVAAVTEELCKYYTFRSIEHPDLIFLTGLNRVHLDDEAVDGGLVKYPFASHQVSELNRNRSFGEQSAYSHRSNRSRKSQQLIERTGTREDEFDEDDNDVRTHRQRAMAITTGMISVAVGLACAENFLYVFVLGGATQSQSRFDMEDSYRNDVLQEWIVLFFRSIFPIHALSAALQSINMIRKFVEGSDEPGQRIGVGRIILPAVLLHGTFDAVLMGINVYQETAWDRYLEETNGNVGEDGPYNTLLVNLVAWFSISAVMLSGVVWYYRENRKQSQRLKVLEEQTKTRQNGSEWNPTTAELV